MKRSLGASAVAALASTAAAQVVGVSIEIDQPVLAPGESTTVRLVASFPDTDYALAGVALDVLYDTPIAEPRSHWSDLCLLPPFDGPGTPHTLEADRVDGIIAGQLNFPPAMIYADPTNPIAFWQATFTVPFDADGGYRVDLTTEVTKLDAYIARDSSTSESRLDILVEDSTSIVVVPAPASAAVLLGLVATRRRRR